MHWLDWAVLALYALVAVAFAIWFARRGQGSHSGEEYMIAGRRLPWWIVGIADVATMDGADAFWIYVFFVGGFIGYYRFHWLSAIVALPAWVLWARYWRRLRLVSPGQLYEERYGGEAAGYFRAVAAVWLVLITNGVLIAYILRGFAQSVAPFLGWPEDLVLIVFCGTTLLYTLLSGLLAVAYTDVVQFALMMVGRVLLAVIVVRAAGGLTAVLDRIEQVRGPHFLLPFPPSADRAVHGEFAVEPLSLVALMLWGLLMATKESAQVQRALAAKNELHAAVGQLFGALLSLIVRLIPMMIVGLVAVATLKKGRTDTNMWADLVRTQVPPGLVGFLLCGIVAGYVSIIDSLVNYGASVLLNDVYRRHLNPRASERQQVLFGRVATCVVISTAALWARMLIGKIDAAWINYINTVINLFLAPVALMRWIWWRVNLWGEMAGFLLGFPLSYAVWFGVPDVVPAFKDRPYWQAFGVLTGLSCGLVLLVTCCTPPEKPAVLRRFYQKVRPPGWWGPIADSLPIAKEERSRQAAEMRGDLLAAPFGMLFSAALVVAVGALFARRSLLCTAMVAVAGVAAALFVRLTLRSERLRGGHP